MSTLCAVRRSLAGTPPSPPEPPKASVTSTFTTGGGFKPNCGGQSTDPVTSVAAVGEPLPRHGRAAAPISVQYWGSFRFGGAACDVNQRSRSKQSPLGLWYLVTWIRSTPPLR